MDIAQAQVLEAVQSNAALPPYHVIDRLYRQKVMRLIRYMALGDSITAGRDASSPQRAYVRLAAASLRKNGFTVSETIVAANGWTSKNLLGAVRSLPPAVIAQTTVVTVWIGGNDIRRAGLALLQGAPVSILQPALAAFERNLDSIVNTIQTVSRARILLCSQYNPFPNTPIAAEGIGLLNTHIQSAAARHGLAVVPVDSWFAGDEPRLISGYRTGRLEDLMRKPLFAPNPIHPNDAGHARIAQGLAPYLPEVRTQSAKGKKGLSR